MVAMVFFDVEKAYDLVWKEGLTIKLDGELLIGFFFFLNLIDIFRLRLEKHYLPGIKQIRTCMGKVDLE